MTGCPVHPDLEAAKTCERCGAFACGVCLPSVGRAWCVTCRGRVLSIINSKWTRRAVGWSARTTQLLLLLSLVSGLFEWVGLLQGATDHSALGTIVDSIRLLGFLAIVAWTGAATSHARDLGWPVGSPAWAATSWLIPGVSFVVPFLAIRRLVPTDRQTLVWGWALFSGASTILSVAVVLLAVLFGSARGNALSDPRASELLSLYNTLSTVGALALFLHDLFAIRTVREAENVRLRDEAGLVS
jgi:hypothetical protein